MSKSYMPWERWRVQNHCAEGRCRHVVYSNPNCLRCKNFMKLVREGKNPTNCLWYDATLDYRK